MSDVWTEQRVDTLKRLWAAGASCSEIAAALGGDITRNAVIGKVHRLKLAGRQPGVRADGRPARPARPAQAAQGGRSQVYAGCASMQPRKRSGFPVDFRSPAAKLAQPQASPPPTQPGLARVGHNGAQVAAKPVQAAQACLQARPAEGREGAAGEGWGGGDPAASGYPHRCALVDLRHDSCRWPLGTPGTPDFFFCGTPAEGQRPNGAPLPYCAHHARLAYQPARRINTDGIAAE